ncbi:MAG: glycosyltransferase [Patescibacteria group bacterium]
MRPTQPYHSLSNHYRRLGGLRELDFYVQGALRHWESSDEACGIAILCNKDPQLALPFLALGMQVTATFDSDKDLEQAKEIAAAAGLELNGIIGNFEQLPNKTFNSIVSPDFDLSVLDALKNKIKDNGRLFVKVESKKEKLEKIRDATRGHAFRVFRSMNLGIASGSKGLKKDKYFHLTDWLDGLTAACLPEYFSRAWLLELFPSSESPLVLQVLPTFLMGGAEIVAMNLSEKLPELGFETMMLSLVSGGALESRIKSKGINYIKLERVPGYGRIKIFFELINILKNLKPQIVHTHLFASDTWGRLAAKFAGAERVITTEHNVFCDYGTLGRVSLILLSGFSDAYVAVSNQVKIHMARDYWIKKEKIKVIYNGIDLSKIKKRSASPFHDVPRVLFVGRLEEQKNPILLLRALANIKRPWKLDIAGSGSLRPALEGLVAQLSLEARVRFLGNVSTADLYAEYDVFVFPSLWEGLGLAVIEAAVAGLPIVASDIGPLKELFDQDEVLFVKPNSEEDLQQALAEVLNKPMYFVAKANATAMKEKWNEFSEEKMAQAYAGLYRKMLGQGDLPAPFSAEAIKTSTIFHV